MEINKRTENEYKNWVQKFDELKNYIDSNNKIPVGSDRDDKVVQISTWTNRQVYNYKNKIQSMTNPEIHKMWEQFINDDKYHDYFISNHDLWMKHFEEFKLFIDKHGKRPSSKSTGDEKKLSGWSAEQLTMFPKQKKAMADESIRKIWSDFVKSDEYSEYFLSKDAIWEKNFECVKVYITEHKKRPSNKSADANTKHMGTWLCQQICSFKKQKMESTRSERFKEFMENEQFNRYL
jgi:hypothetical protein